MPEKPRPLPSFTRWPSFPFEGDLRVKELASPVEVEPPRSGEDAAECIACQTPDEAYIWVSERWRVRAMDRPTGLPVVLILECRSHLDLGDLPNLLAAELGVMTVRLERAVRSLDGVARVHVNRWGDGAAHLHIWFLARPYGRLQLRGTFLPLWDDILPVLPERQWRENLGLVAAWLGEFGGRAIAEPPHIAWQSPGTIGEQSPSPQAAGAAPGSSREAVTRDLSGSLPGGDKAPVATPTAAGSGEAVTRDLSASLPGGHKAPLATPAAAVRLENAVTRDLSGAAPNVIPGQDYGVAETPMPAAAPTPTATSPADGSPTVDPSASGVPASGVRASGVPASGAPASGVPASGRAGAGGGDAAAGAEQPADAVDRDGEDREAPPPAAR